MGAKVRIIKEGYQYGKVSFAHISFTDGVSDQELSDRDITFLGSIISIESVVDAESDDEVETLGPSASLVKLTKASTEENLSLRQAEAVAIKKAESEGRVAAKVAAAKRKSLTRYQLEDVAQKGGIKRLRSIGDPLGVRGKEIKTLIDRILVAQEKLEHKEAKTALESAELEEKEAEAT